jgi:hypothetical protein
MSSIELNDGERGIVLAALLDFKNTADQAAKDPKMAMLVTALSKNFGMGNEFGFDNYVKMIDGLIEKVKA